MLLSWQVQTFKPYARHGIICFIDEPILSAFGSSTYVSVSRDDVIAMLAEVIEAVHADGALAGIHCCGNTDWSLPIEAGADIVNFDAYGFGETVAMYPEHMKAHLEAGKILAWGVVPVQVPVIANTDELIVAGERALLDRGYVQPGQEVVVIAGNSPLRGATNMMKIDVIDEG